MAAARRDAIEGVLRGFGPSVRVTAKSTSGIISAVIISAQSAKDKEKPKLDTTSIPRKGKKVKAGDKIKVTMVARDHANLWQSGIKTIQLVAESEGGRFIASENFPPASLGCTALPPERRVEATYRFPPTRRRSCAWPRSPRTTPASWTPTSASSRPRAIGTGRSVRTHLHRRRQYGRDPGTGDLTLDYDGQGT